jgi:hypothetical protein
MIKRRKHEPMGIRVSERIRSDGHLAWVRSRRCLADGWEPCDRKMHAHHVRTAVNAGTGVKPPDSATIPLCSLHHRFLHDRGVDWFERTYSVDLKAEAERHWRESPHHIKHERKQKEQTKCP